MPPWTRDAFDVARRWSAAVVASVRDNLTLGLLAVGVAVAFWIYVTDQENPTVTVEVTPAVRVRAVNVPEGLAVLGLSEPVSVRASAPEDVAQRLNAADFRATVNLEGRSLGTHDVPVRVEHLGSGRNVRVTQVAPSRVSVTLQSLRSVTVPVRAEIAARPGLRYEADDRISADPATVRVSGAEDLIARVVETVARIDLAKATKDIDANVELVATNGSGAAIEGVVIEPPSVRVRVAVRQTLFERAFAVSPRIKGSPAVGYSIGSIDVEPATAVLQGPLAALDRIDAVPTDEVDIAGAVADVVQQAKLSLPQGVRLKSAVQTVQVRIRVAPSTARATFGVPPVFENLSDGLQARALTPLVEVEVEGPLPQLRALGPPAFTAVINLSDLGVGRHDVPVTARAPNGLRVIAVRPERVAVEITR